MSIFGGPIIGMIIIGLIWILPIFVILSSRRTSGNEKIAWVLAVVFISWFAFIIYLLMAPIKRN